MIDPNPSLGASARMKKFDRARDPGIFLAKARGWIAEAAAGMHKSRIQLATTGCRWIEGDPREGHAAFCGEPCDGSWCGLHRARVFVAGSASK